jgi:hypothetical protein
LDKSGRYVLLQDDIFLRALLNSYGTSKHFTHKIAPNQALSLGEKIQQEIYNDLKRYQSVESGDFGEFE